LSPTSTATTVDTQRESPFPPVSISDGINAVRHLLWRDPFVLLLFLSLLTLGSDELAIRLGGITLRVAFPIIMTAFAALYIRQSGNIAFDRHLSILFCLWTISALASTFQSYQPAKSLGYTAWLLFNFFFIIGLGYNFSRNYGPKLALALWFLVFRIHAALVFLELIFFAARGIFVRPSLWFYEPSYLAIFMIAYFGSALFMLLREGKAYRFDFLLAAATMLVISSATAILAIFLATLLNILIARQRLKLILWATSAIAAFLFLLHTFFASTSYYALVAGFLLGEGNIVQLILGRGGNRVVRAYIGLEAFQQHPWLGIGIGADAAYMERSPIPEEAATYVKTWINVAEGQPFSNVIIEVLGTTGLIGLIPFTAIVIYAAGRMLQQIRKRTSPETVAFFVGFFSIFMALQFESTVLRYYLWSPLGLALGSIVYNRIAAAGQHGNALQQPVFTPIRDRT